MTYASLIPEVFQRAFCQHKVAGIGSRPSRMGRHFPQPSRFQYIKGNVDQRPTPSSFRTNVRATKIKFRHLFRLCWSSSTLWKCFKHYVTKRDITWRLPVPLLSPPPWGRVMLFVCRKTLGGTSIHSSDSGAERLFYVFVNVS